MFTGRRNDFPSSTFPLKVSGLLLLLSLIRFICCVTLTYLYCFGPDSHSFSLTRFGHPTLYRGNIDKGLEPSWRDLLVPASYRGLDDLTLSS